MIGSNIKLAVMVVVRFNLKVKSKYNFGDHGWFRNALLCTVALAPDNACP
ncbi:hypothetical protein M8C21_013080 [Ambrosia artemisiifolia]|uniref:Uncharacterized protein n=1 Tax=Ambrosia artemisiifolia TaxID=4212 RepID=A0AAD5C096_AMBAR|nr:hypothetical protein M8C21_013080 [Ambrosia artemisiifolia]